MKEYEGKIRFVYRDFPLENIHPNAVPAAIAAHCAGEQEAYFPFHDALFSGELGLNREAYLTYAERLGLDVTAFQTCLDEARYAEKVQDNLNYGLSLEVNSTPTFFVNGTHHHRRTAVRGLQAGDRQRTGRAVKQEAG